ncbi:hypothetical protein KFU94_27755 [Chloroflexi bacterium TSY]|nr:hypothetical protein [Chloroflexi bacterium TSY]
MMLHLQPRLRAAQERRSALGSVGPDLARITNFALLMPESLLDHNGQSLFYVRQFPTEQDGGPDLEPFYLEQQLTKIDQAGTDANERRLAGLFTAAERRGSTLFRMAEPNLRPLSYTNENANSAFRTQATGLTPRAYRLNQPTNDLRHATRADMFHTALEHADHVARLLETHLVDPIREDNLAPNDPFVQTTLYVVASLYEPLTTALIWPTVAQLMQRMERRNLSHVVGLFATGSYANDESRALENAATYAALSELEIFTGLRNASFQNNPLESMSLQSSSEGSLELASVVQGANSPLISQFGKSLFDQIYLLDREKSNQGLSQNSHELAILVGNALETFVAANGNLFVQEQVGIGLHGIEFHGGAKRPYSLIGAATDYVPLAEILRAVNRQEGRRLAQQWALHATQNETIIENPLTKTVVKIERPTTTLANLGMSLPNALAQMTQLLPELYLNPAPSAIEDLSVQVPFILSKTAAVDLRRSPAGEWPTAFEQHLEKIEEVFELAVGSQALDQTWGLSDSELYLDAVEGKTNPQPKLLGALLHRIEQRLLEQLAASPAGLPHARKQVAIWLHEVDDQLESHRHVEQTISTAATPELAPARYELARREWFSRYERAIERVPKWWRLLLGIGISIAIVAFIATLYLYSIERTWNPVNDSVALAGFGLLMSLAGALFYRQRVLEVTKLRRERVELAQTELTAQLQVYANQGILRLYDRLLDRLQRLARMMTEAEAELSRWSDEDGHAGVSDVEKLIPATYKTHLRQPKINRELWQRAVQYLHQQQSVNRAEDAGRLVDLWRTPEWRNELERLLTGVSAHQTERLRGQPQASSIADLIRQTVGRTMMSVSIEEDGPARTALVRELAEKFGIENLLWRNRIVEQQRSRYLRAIDAESIKAQEGPIVYSEIRSKHQYVETAWSRAKPAANYDVVDRLATRGTTVEFAAASGDPQSDLTRSLLEEFGVTLLPTEDPFSISFVRTVHGLGLDDLDSIQRYRTELRFLSAEERALVLLTSDPEDKIYQYQASSNLFPVDAFEPDSDSPIDSS